MNICAIRVDLMRQSTHSCPVGVFQAFSRKIDRSSNVGILPSLYRKSLNKTVHTIYKARIARGQFFPFNILVKPLNAAPISSSRPNPLSSLQINPINDRPQCIPPGCITVLPISLGLTTSLELEPFTIAYPVLYVLFSYPNSASNFYHVYSSPRL